MVTEEHQNVLLPQQETKPSGGEPGNGSNSFLPKKIYTYNQTFSVPGG